MQNLPKIALFTMQNTIFLAKCLVTSKKILPLHPKTLVLIEIISYGSTFEVGGKNKGRKQLSEAERGFVVKDDIEYTAPGTIPLWMFGFLY